MKQLNLTLFLALLLILSCKNQPEQNESSDTTSAFTVDKKPFGSIEDQEITLYKLSNKNGFAVEIINYGAAVVSILAPDKNGAFGDVVLGFDSLAGYLQEGNPYFGCIAGRYANRIAKAQFTLNGATYQLSANDNQNTLHGGLKGFAKYRTKK